jgi:hypothetical protein
MAVVIADSDQWNSLQAKALEARLSAAFDAFQHNEIDSILIKGWAIARKYPKERVRRPGDIDLAVDPSNFEKAWQISRSPDITKLNIDMHQGLRHLDELDWNELFGHSKIVDLNGTPIRVLCEEDHLRVLATHWLIDGGGYKDKLWDIYYAVENRSPDFDWDRSLNVVSPIRRKWVICAIALAKKYLDLKVDDLPFKDELEPIPPWITRCVEREWARSERLEPVLTSTHDRGLMLRQIARRLPPNPIRATIEANGDLYGHRRSIYQMQVLGRRALPFTRDLLSVVKRRFRGTKVG